MRKTFLNAGACVTGDGHARRPQPLLDLGELHARPGGFCGVDREAALSSAQAEPLQPNAETAGCLRERPILGLDAVFRCHPGRLLWHRAGGDGGGRPERLFPPHFLREVGSFSASVRLDLVVDLLGSALQQLFAHLSIAEEIQVEVRCEPIALLGFKLG